MFSNRLRALRKGAKLSLKELAHQLNNRFPDSNHPNTSAQISNWERGVRVPSYLEVRKLAVFFNVSMDYLAGRNSNGHYNLATLLNSNSELVFNDTELDSDDRREIQELINGYLHSKRRNENQQSSKDANQYQEHLDLNIDDYRM